MNTHKGKVDGVERYGFITEDDWFLYAQDNEIGGWHLTKKKMVEDLTPLRVYDPKTHRLEAKPPVKCKWYLYQKQYECTEKAVPGKIHCREHTRMIDTGHGNGIPAHEVEEFLNPTLKEPKTLGAVVEAGNTLLLTLQEDTYVHVGGGKWWNVRVGAPFAWRTFIKPKLIK